MSRAFAHGITNAYLKHLESSDTEAYASYTDVNNLYLTHPGQALELFKLIPDEFAKATIHRWDVYQQVKNFLFKRPDKITNPQAEKKAITVFMECEEACYNVKPFKKNDRHVSRVREIIFRILGEFDDRALWEIHDRAHPGNGQSIGLWNRYRTSRIHKFVACDWTCTSRAAHHALPLVETLREIHFKDEVRNLAPVVGAKQAFVPKDISTFRTVFVEPNVNMWLQLGVHEYLVPRLLRVGVNLQDQGTNQYLARIGSIFGSYATVDFSNASDMISDTLMHAILPPSWYNFLSSIRSRQIERHDGDWMRLHKFSTMGNGFTFALESLVFYAMARSVTSGHVSVFGDDVVLPVEAYDDFVKLSDHFGLTLNKSKSFVKGPFRESCGTDWWSGQCVTPLRLKDEEVTQLTCHRLYNNWGKRPGAKDVKAFIVAYASCHYRELFYGLPNEDDTTCFFTTFKHLKSDGLLTYKKRWQSYTFRGLKLKSVRDGAYPSEWRYLAALAYGASEAEVSNSLRDCQKTVVINLTGGVHLTTHTFRATRLV